MARRNRHGANVFDINHQGRPRRLADLLTTTQSPPALPALGPGRMPGQARIVWTAPAAYWPAQADHWLRRLERTRRMH
jgi:hypothetical protein